MRFFPNFPSAILQFFRTRKEWAIALPIIAVLFISNVIFRSTDYQRFNILHSLFTYLMYLTGGVAFLISSYRYKKIIWSNILLLLCLFVLLEIIFFFILGMPYRHNISFSTSKLKKDTKLAQLGYLPEANQRIPEVRVKNGDTLFQVFYTIDSLNRRVTPEPDSARNEYAIFFGCSVTYGYGVNDAETMPAYFQQKSHRFRAYNYAYNGYGTQNMLAHLERGKMRDEVIEENGMGVYIFIWHHVLRSIGDMYSYSWGWRLPYYKQTKAGPKRKGNFADDRWLVSTFYEWACQSNIVKYFKFQFPLQIKQDHFELVADMILKSKKLYEEQFGNDRFYLIVYPGEFDRFRDDQKEMFLNMLEERGIRYWVYKNIYPIDDAHHVPDDPHPNGRAHEKVASQLIKDLEPLP